MKTDISSKKNTALSRRDALRLLEIIHASLFCTTEKELMRIVDDVKTMADIDSAAAACRRMPDHHVGNDLPQSGGRAWLYTPRARVIFKHVGPHLHRTLSELSDGVVKKGDRDVSLTSREKEILLWVKEGKSTWEISTIL